MSDQTSPETDAFSGDEYQWRKHSEKLECERDQLRTQNAALLADCVVMRGVMKKCSIRCEHCDKLAVYREPFTEGYALCKDHAKAECPDGFYPKIQHPANAALTTPSPGAPLIEAARKAVVALRDAETDFACYEGVPKYPAKNSSLKMVRAALAELEKFLPKGNLTL